MPAPGAMLGMGVDDMEWGVMPARPDLGGKPEPGPVEGADCAGGYGFTAGYVCGCGVSGRPAGGLLTFILASGGGGEKGRRDNANHFARGASWVINAEGVIRVFGGKSY